LPIDSSAWARFFLSFQTEIWYFCGGEGERREKESLALREGIEGLLRGVLGSWFLQRNRAKKKKGKKRPKTQHLILLSSLLQSK